jgi:glycosyltransferase involved in cell wall biosynthesis
MSRALVLLTLNEIDGVRAIVPKLHMDGFAEVLAVDGGSTDGTREFLVDHGFQLVEQPQRGRGEAFRTAVRESNAETVVFFSPDGNEDPADIPLLCEKVESGADMAIASRFMIGSRNEEDDSRLPLRKWANQAFGFVANSIWGRGRRISDTINGFRAIRREAFHRLSPNSVGFTIEYELTIRALKAGMTIVEIPTAEGQRIGGHTKAHSIRTGLRFLGFLAKEIAFGRRF